MTYFGTRLSENISRREPEGYLICMNVPVARTGTQDYLPSELGLPEPDSRLIPVHRPEEEVFSDACIASFEGMPVTDDHPSNAEGVTAENSQRLQRGHVQHVRRGTGEESDLLLADLIITHPVLIDEVLSGKREISCGYTYTLCEEDGKFIQRDIRGNHVAVVDAGRAGPRVSIKDQEQEPVSRCPASPNHSFRRCGKITPSAPASDEQQTNFERSTLMKKKSLWRAKLMARMAQDGDVDGLAEIITELMEEPEAPAVAVAVPAEAAASGALPAADPMVAAVVTAVEENLNPVTDEEVPVVVETPVEQPVIIDCGPQILEALTKIIALLSGTGADCDPENQDCDPDAARDDDPVAEAVTETVAAELAENVAEAAMEAVAETVDPELTSDDDPEDPIDALVAEILESDEGSEEDDPAADDEEEIFSSILEPETEQDDDPEDDPTAAADALRATLATFRPMLKRMTPKERQRFNADVAARMKKLTRKQSQNGKPNAYAALRKAASHDASARNLGQKIMANRNVNYRMRNRPNL